MKENKYTILYCVFEITVLVLLRSVIKYGSSSATPTNYGSYGSGSDSTTLLKGRPASYWKR